MKRDWYARLAAQGLRMPVGTDLVLHEEPDPEAVMRDGERLGRVMERAARRWQTPLALSLMDLRLEKADLLRAFGVAESEVDTFHFDEPPAIPALDPGRPFAERNLAQAGAVRYIAERTDLVPVGMTIGPFSLTTKLMADPITHIAMAGMGLGAAEDAGVALAEACLALAEATVARSVSAQAAAGAKAMLVCEPAANVVYISPKQLAAGSDIFERFVMRPNLRLKRQLDEAGVDLIFHDCGELNTEMVRQFATRIDPVVLSLGSSRKLWEDAAVVPKHVVLYGNLPTKTFYSDEAMPVERVRELTAELVARMREAAHPHVLGSECDVLHVADAADTIRAKVEAMLTWQR